LDDIAEEVLEELFEEGYSVEQCEAIFEEFLTEARVTYGRQTESPRAKKMFAMESSLKGAIGKVKENAASGAVKSYGAYRDTKQAKANRLKEGASYVTAQTQRDAIKAKAKVRDGMKGMIGEAAKKVGDAANKVSSRMGESAVRKDVGDIYQAIYEKEGSKPDYLDFDGDGNEKEPMKKALSDKKNGKKAMGKKEVQEGKLKSAIGGGVGNVVGTIAGGIGGAALGSVAGPVGALAGAAGGAKLGGAAGAATGAALGAKKGRKKSAAVAAGGGSLVAGTLGAATGGAIASEYIPTGVTFSEAELKAFEDVVNSWED
jgi:hypothetical protein